MLVVQEQKVLAPAFAAAVYQTNLPHQFAEYSAVMEYFKPARPAFKLPSRCV